MSGELNIKLSLTGKTILALILGQNRTTRWNGSAMVAISSISAANWLTGMITLVEQLTSDSTPTGTYVGDFPAGIAAAGEYAVEYYLDTAATPGSPFIGSQDVNWNGASTVTLPNMFTTIFDTANAIDNVSFREAIQIICAILSGKVSGAGSSTEIFRSLDDETNRVTVNSDIHGNRSTVVFG